MHGPDLDNMSHLLALEDTIPTASRHTSNVEEFGAINHVIIWFGRSAKTGPDSEWTSRPRDGLAVPSRRATHTPLASTWKQRLPSSSHSVAVTLGFIPGGAIWPVVSN
jgi:hypothetical protein